MEQFPILYHHGTLEQTPYIERRSLALDPTIRNTTESGLVLSRARFTRIPRIWRLRFDDLSASNMAILRTFEAARSGGSEMFAFIDPEYSLTNLLTNPGFETVPDFTGWLLWGTPDLRQITGSGSPHEGSRHYHHIEATGSNDGSEQAISCYPGFSYTLSVWVFRTVTPTPTIWMVTYNDTIYTGVFPTADNVYQQISQTIITGPTQTSLSMWIGGKGNAYFDLASISTPMIRARFLDPLEFVPIEGTARKRWTATLTIEEA